jgi:hypothetical protein
MEVVPQLLDGADSGGYCCVWDGCIKL